MKVISIATLAVLFVAVVVGLAHCTSVTPDAGHEAVLVRKPFILKAFYDDGVVPTSVKSGRQFISQTTQVHDVNRQPQQFPEHFDDLMSSDGVPLDFDSIIRLRVTDSVVLVRSFGPKWFENNVQAEFRNRVRQAVRKHGMNETAIDTKAIDAIDTEISNAMEEYLKQADLPLQLIQVTVGKANPPDSIKNQRVETAAQQQRQLTEQQRKLAEDQRKMAEESRAKADNAYREAMQLSPEQYLRLETIKMYEKVGSRGATFIIGGAGVSPVVNVEKK